MQRMRAAGLFGIAATAGVLVVLSGGASRSDAQSANLPNAASHLLPPRLEWAWSEPVTLPDSIVVQSMPAVADLDMDGEPDVVFVSTWTDERGQYRGSLRAVRGHDGSEIFSIDSGEYLEGDAGVAVGDIDGDGYPEVIGRHHRDSVWDDEKLVAFEHTGELKWTSEAIMCHGNKANIAIADIDHDGNPEIIICASVVNNDGSVRWSYSISSLGSETSVADIDMSGDMEIIDGGRVYSSDGAVKWEFTGREGIYDSAVANLDQDPLPEVVMIGRRSMYIVSHEGALQAGPIDLPRDEDWDNSGFSGLPTIADVDGDGDPEIGVASRGRYSVVDHDGTLKWSVPVGDWFLAQGAAAADLNGDGAAEIVYHGEDALTIFRGTDGQVLWSLPSPAESRGSMLSSPVIVDVDGDGQVEIVSSWLSRRRLSVTVPGIQVFGHESWMPGRPVWNQSGYHITNVNDDGSIPRDEEPSWLKFNSYRASEPLQGLPPAQKHIFVPLALAEQGRKARLASDIVVAVDTSSSMSGEKLTAAKDAIRLLLEQVDWRQDRLALVAFDEVARLSQPLTDDRDSFEAALVALATSPGTRIDEGLRLGREELSGGRGRSEDANRAVVLLTDGLQEAGSAKAMRESHAIQETGAQLVLIGLGADVDRGLLQRLAQPNGHSYFAPGPMELAEIYREIGRMIACRPEEYWGKRCR